MPQDLGSHTVFKATATGFTTLSSVGCAIKGILFTSTGTAFCRIFNAPSTASATASNSLSADIIAYATVAAATANPAVYYPFPGMTSDGLTISIGASADPNLSLFYDPMSFS